MTAAHGDSPAVARQRVRRAIRAGRKTSEMTQSDVAQRLGWSLSKVQRIESAEVAVSETDLRALLQLFGVIDERTVEGLSRDARISRRERWWTAPEYRTYLHPGLRQLLQFETVAAEIRAYQPHLIPGILQTPAMADYVIGEWGREVPPEGRQVRYDVRLLRRKQVIERSDGPNYLLILDESVIERKTGGAKMMAEQLEDLAEVAARPNVFVRIVPLDKGGVIAHLGAFIVLDLSDEDTDDSVLYSESFRKDEISHDQVIVHRYREFFETVWEQAFDEAATLRLIIAKAAVLRSSMDRS
jgi:transcriptional regulator with XRE-family HTH domain